MRKAGAGYRNVDRTHFLGWQGHNVFCPAFKRLAHPALALILLI